MRKLLTLILFFSITQFGFSQTNIHTESFETDGDGTRYYVTGGFSDGIGDYFVRTNGVDVNNPSGMPAYSGSDGSFYFAGEDTQDGDNPNTDESFVEFRGINISGYSNIEIVGAFACGGQEKFDPPEYMHIYASVDNGDTTLIGAFEADISTGYNSANFGLDADLDGLADGPTFLSTTFDDYTFSLGKTGSSLYLRVEVFMSAGDEEAAFDYIRVQEAGGDAEPSVTNVQRNEKVPAEDANTTVTATVTDDNGLTLVELRYQINGGTTQSVSMTNTSGDTYSADIPASAYTDGDAVDYWVYAEDNASPAQSDQSGHSYFMAGTTSMIDVHPVDTNGINTYLNYYVRLRGISTVNSGTFSASNLDVNFQDATAGIVLYSGGDGAINFTLGNDYTVIGKIAQYNGKLEIIPDDASTEITDNGASTVPEPVEKTIAELLANPETYEGLLIKIVDVTKTSGDWPAEGTSVNLEITDGSGGQDTLTMRIDSDTDIDGSTEGTYPLTVIGIMGQYDSSSPYTEGYQILPRSTEDLDWSPNAINDKSINELITEFKLFNNYPNPFNPTTTINYHLSAICEVNLSVYDIAGQLVQTLVNTRQNQGAHLVTFNAANLSSGTYIYRLNANGNIFTKKMLLLK